MKKIIDIRNIKIDPVTNTMKSTDLHRLVYMNTGKYEQLSHFHRKIKKVLINHHDPVLGSSTKDNRGYVSHYNLTEIQCHMIMASVDVVHLEMVVTIFIKARDLVFKPTTIDDVYREKVLQATLQDRIAIEHDKIAAKAKIERAKQATLLHKEAVAVKLLDAKVTDTNLKIEALRTKLSVSTTVRTKADVVASRIGLPRKSITELLRGTGIKPVDANTALVKLGLLASDRQTITKKGMFYGSSWVGGSSHNPKWYELDFETDLLIKIKSKL